MSGWRANGNTSPWWRGCFHVLTISGRCSSCRATYISDYSQQGRPKNSITGAPLGSPDLVPPNIEGLRGGLPAGEGGIKPKEWNRQLKRKEAA